jgi:pseudouridine kinase
MTRRRDAAPSLCAGRTAIDGQPSGGSFRSLEAGLNGIVCIGGATIDCTYRARERLRPATSNPARAERSFGGVARNVAENLARLGNAASLATLVGDDERGHAILAHLAETGVDTRLVALAPRQRTAEYVALIEPDGELFIGIADMDIMNALTVDHIDAIWPEIAAARWVFADCNLPADVLSFLIGQRRQHAFRLAIEAVSAPKVMKLPPDLNGIDVLFLNRDEAQALLHDPTLSPHGVCAALLARGADHVVQTQGADGVLIGTLGDIFSLPAVAADGVDVTGAGDALTAALLDGLDRGMSIREAARLGTLAAALTLECVGTVRPDLSPSLLRSAMPRLETADLRKAP